MLAVSPLLKRRFFISFALAACFIIWAIHIHLDLSQYTPSTVWPSRLSFGKTTEVPSLPSLRQLCDETTWIDGRWLQCHSGGGDEGTSFYGGLTNVRSRLQTCLRLAIDSGSGLIVANIAIRNQTKLKDLGGGGIVDASKIWDTDFLSAVVASECPQLKLRLHGDVSGIETILPAPVRHWSQLAFHKDTFRNMTDTIFAASNITSITPSSPVALSFSDSFIAWDYSKSHELGTVRKDLFKTITYNRTLLDMSTQILRSAQLQSGFIGVHLRAEKDWPHAFGAAHHQMRLYQHAMESIERAVPSDLRTVYVSCGNQTAIQTFRDRLAPLGYTVTDKWSLLASNPSLLAAMESLAFDEKGAVEYEMLVNADYFMGPITSSMTTLIAYARTVDAEEDFFRTHVWPHGRAEAVEGSRMRFYDGMSMQGDERTKVMVISSTDRMDFFP